jgi:hypothetical protein
MQSYRWLVVFGLAALAGCAHQAGKGAAKGALNEVREQAQHPEEGPPPLEIGSKNMVRGALTELDTPERQAQLARIAGAMTRGFLSSAAGNQNPAFGWGGGPANAPQPSVSPSPSLSPGAFPIATLGGRLSEGFTLGMSKQLQAELGPSGDGPLAKSLTAMTEQMSGAAANGLARGLTPELGDCDGADRAQCTERRVQQLSRSAAVGFAQGLGAALSIPLLVVGFVSGLLVALVAFGLTRLMRLRAPA